MKPWLRLTVTAGALLLEVATAFAADPVPRMVVNGTDTLTANPGDRVSVSIGMDPGSHAGENVDWWLLAFTPVGWFSYDISHTPPAWRPGQAVTFRGALFGFPLTEIATGSGLPPGSYDLYFGIDPIPDGNRGRFEEMEIRGAGRAAGVACEEGICVPFVCTSLADTATLSRTVSPDPALTAEVATGVAPERGLSIRRLLRDALR